MNRILKRAGLYVLLLVLSGCSWLRPQAPAPQVQVCPPQVCPVCTTKACPAPKIIEKEKIVTVPI